MNSLWDEAEAAKYAASDLDRRVYTARLLGMDDNLVMHGGGCTSVKTTQLDIFAAEQALLCIKGDDRALKTIAAEDFVALDCNRLLKLAGLDGVSDTAMIRALKCAMTDPAAPQPPLESILHALIPFKFVDFSHADALLAIGNTPDGAARIKALYGDRVLVLPSDLTFGTGGVVAVKPLVQALRATDLSACQGIVWLGHGIFTFADDSQTAYEQMIALVGEAESSLMAQGAWEIATALTATEPEAEKKPAFAPLSIAKMRKQLAQHYGAAMIVGWHHDRAALAFSALDNVADIATRGPLVPGHVIDSKSIPMLLGDDIAASIAQFADRYQDYFDRYATVLQQQEQPLDAVPRVVIAPQQGFFTIAVDIAATRIIGDIYRHTLKVIQQAEKLGGWMPVEAKILFAHEYSLQAQAKRQSASAKASFAGKVAFVTGAASGIGKATVRALLDKGACVIGSDINHAVSGLFGDAGFLGVVCDVRSAASIDAAFTAGVQSFGGIDMVVSNAGTFPDGALVAELPEADWITTLDINLSGHYRVIKSATPYLKAGIDPGIVIIGSKNVAAPGPGVAAYSCAKAGLTQLARVSALELAQFGIRVNVLHPNAVFDTDIWTDEVLQARAANYGMNVEAYKKNNLLKTVIGSEDVARLVVALSSNDFAKTTGAQIPIDGGNERVI